MNVWLKRSFFNLDLNRESVSESRTLSGRLFQSLGAKYENILPPLVEFAILGTTKSPEFIYIYVCYLDMGYINEILKQRAFQWN